MNKNLVIGVLALLTLLSGYFALRNNGFLGANATGQAHYQLENFLQGLTVGTSGGATKGTSYRLIRSGTCTLIGDSSITATSTGLASCTGITGYVGASGDVVRLQLAASTTLASQFVVKSAYASTTASGSIEAVLINLTGANRVPSSVNGFGSSTVFQIFRPQ